MHTGEDTRKYRQFKLKAGNTTMTTWLEDEKRLKVGTQLTLKDDDEMLWTIEERYSTISVGRPHTDWNNNI